VATVATLFTRFGDCWRTWLACAFCLALGCGGGTTTSPPAPLEGSVRWADGTDAGELAGGAVEFEANGAVVAKAELIADGTFTVPEPLPPAKYRVRLVPPASAKSMLDRRFQEFDKSGLEVNAGAAAQSVAFRVTKGR
jgi:hypothetical protein